MDGITPEQYDQARDVVDWDNDVPTCAVFHVASFAAGQRRVTDVWESSQDFQRFVEDCLMPGVHTVGIAGQPRVVTRPAHCIFSLLMTPSARG